MNISKEKCQMILDTLPIGYYIGHNVTCEMTDDKNSYADMLSETVHISYPAIMASLKNAPAEYDPERQVRAHLYHELSHILLTPKFIMEVKHGFYSIKKTNQYLTKEEWCKICNIFEDERIESVLRTYYYGVDFRESVALENPPPAKLLASGDPIKMFFAAVRFRVHPKKVVLNKISDIIREFSALNKAFRDNRLLVNYQMSIRDLYMKYFADQTNQVPDSQPQEPGQGTDNPQENESDRSGTAPRQSQSDQHDQPDQRDQSTSDKLPDARSDEEIMTAVTQEFQRDFGDDSASINDTIDTLVKEVANKILVNQEAARIKERVSRIVQTAMNKHANQMNSHAAYSGRIDPRLVRNKNYRWFTQKNAKGSAGTRYSKIKINLFIDTSGSFCCNENSINALLMALRDLHDTMPEFLFDAVTMSQKNELLPSDKRSVKCNGCNNLSEEIFGLFRQVQNPNAKNINVIVFDGDAWSGAEQANPHNMSVFNHPNCILISDPNNQSAIEEYASLSHHTIINDKYCDVFMDKIFESLTYLLA